MSNRTLKQMTQIQQPKFGHYPGEFLIHGVWHSLTSAKCDFFNIEHPGFRFETSKNALRCFECTCV